MDMDNSFSNPIPEDDKEQLATFIAEIESGKVKPSIEGLTEAGNQVYFWFNQNLAYLRFINRSNQPQRTDYFVSVYADGRWRLHTQGYVTVQPNVDYTQGFHQWRAENWYAEWR
jgi:hypothetical protein